MEYDIPQNLLYDLMTSVFNNIIKHKNRSLNFFIIYEEGDFIIDVPDFNQRLKLIDELILYFQRIEEYEKCHELVIFKNIAKKYWDIK